MQLHSLSTCARIDLCCLVSCSIAFAFGDTILPEVQATIGGNAKKEMYKGVSCGYSILLSSYMIVAISGACIVLITSDYTRSHCSDRHLITCRT